MNWEKRLVDWEKRLADLTNLRIGGLVNAAEFILVPELSGAVSGTWITLRLQRSLRYSL